jgi:hypothetical protein
VCTCVYGEGAGQIRLSGNGLKGQFGGSVDGTSSLTFTVPSFLLLGRAGTVFSIRTVSGEGWKRVRDKIDLFLISISKSRNSRLSCSRLQDMIVISVVLEGNVFRPPILKFAVQNQPTVFDNPTRITYHYCPMERTHQKEKWSRHSDNKIKSWCILNSTLCFAIKVI